MPETNPSVGRRAYVRTTKRQSHIHIYVGILLVIFSLLLSVITAGVFGVSKGYAATNSTLTFQARILNSSGALIPDGNYNAEFKLYYQSAGGTALWTETYLNQVAGNDLVVKNGYLYANLGSITAFPSIDWDQELWLTLNLGNTNGSCTPFSNCSPDGEMSPRFKLTAVPYAFKAAQAAGVKSADTTAASTNSDNVSITSGNASGATSNSGNISIDSGTATGTTGTISLGATNASGVLLGRSGLTVAVQGGLSVAESTALNGDVTIGNAAADLISFNGTIQGSNALVFEGSTADGFETTISVQDPTADVTIRIPALAAGTYDLCTTSGNCLGVGDILQGGNTYGAAVRIGSNDSYDLELETGNTLRVSIDATTGNVSLTSDLAVNGGDITSSGDLTVTPAGGDLTLDADVVVTAGNALTITGGNTASRPGSPTEGMVYYDSDTDRLLVYSNGKWQADRTTTTKIVAASDSSQALKDSADYVADGTSDQTEINNALTAAAGGKVYLTEGTFTIDASISIPSNTSLTGSGSGTLITIPNALNTGFYMIMNSNAGTTTGNSGIIISNLRIDGKGTANTGNQIGINFDANFSGTTDLRNLKVENVTMQDVDLGIYSEAVESTIINNNIALVATGGVSRGFDIEIGGKNVITGNNVSGGGTGIYIDSSNFNVVTSNTFLSLVRGLEIGSANNNQISSNTFDTISSRAIYLGGSANYNVISSNTIKDSGGAENNNGIYLSSADYNTINGNLITDTSCSTDCYAINIFNATSDKNYLEGNRYSDTDADSGDDATINDAGTGTIYAGQSSGTTTGTDVSNFLFRGANSATAFVVQNTTGTSVFNVDTSTPGVTVTGTATVTSNLTVDTNTLFVNASSDFVSVGSTSDLGGKLQVVGTADETQLLVRANGTQSLSNPLVLLQNSSGSELARINASTSSLYFGNAAGGSNASGADNTAIGASALGAVSTGTANTTLGSGALASITGASNNTAVGYQAGNLATGGNNIFLGYRAGDNVVGGSGNIIIGYDLDASAAGATNELRIGGIIQGSTSTLAAQFNGTLTVVDDATVQGGDLTLGTTAQAGSLIISDGTSNTGTILVQATAGNYTFTIPTVTANDTFCLLSLSNCGSNTTLQQAYTNDADGSDAVITLTSTDGAVVVRDAASTVGNLLVVEANGGTDYFAVSSTQVSLGTDTVLAAGESLTITGGNTASRPGSPTEGMVYYDTTTKQLLTYANSKWQADRTDAILVAASNSSDADKAAADYVADGTGDQTEINNALVAADPASGSRKTGKVVLLAGTYSISASISIYDNTTLAGVGRGTNVELADLDAGIDMIVNQNTSSGTGVVIRDMKLDGRDDLNTAGTQRGIYLVAMGDSTTRQGAKISDLFIEDFRNEAIYFSNTDNSVVSNVIEQSGNYGIYITGSTNNTITDSIFQSNSNYGIMLAATSTNNTVTNNLTQSNSQAGINVNSSSYNTFTNNQLLNNTFFGITMASSTNNNISANVISGNLSYGIRLSSASYNTVSSNNLSNNGDTTINDSIYLTASDYNNIVGNTISDSSCSTNCYAINIFNATSEKNYLEGNRFSGSAANAASINDSGTNTIYVNQQYNSTTSTNSDVTDFRFRGSANSTTTFYVQNASGSNILNVDTTNSEVEVGSSTTAGRLVISDGSSNTGTILVNATAGDYTFTIPTVTANDTFCLATLGNCANGTLQQAYTNDADGSDAVITLTAADGAIVVRDAASSIGTLFVVEANGGTDYFSVSNTMVTAGGDLTVSGGEVYITPVSSSASTTEGTVYYDSDTDRLLVYSNGKWQADRTDAVLVAASDSSQADKDAADYVADGNTGAALDGDQVQINSALTAGSGKKVVLLAGTYVADATILVPNNTVLAGVGKGTIIQLADIDATDNLIEATGTNRTGQVIRDLSLDGQKSAQTGAITQYGIYLDSVGSGSGSGARQGAILENLWVSNFETSGIVVQDSQNTKVDKVSSSDNDSVGIHFNASANNRYNQIINSRAQGNGQTGIWVESWENYVVSNNIASGNTQRGFIISAAYSTVTGNTAYGNGQDGMQLSFGGNSSVTGNHIYNNGVTGITIYNAAYLTVNGNTLQDNGGTDSNEGIKISDDSDYNQIIGNTISDTSCSITCYAINIDAATENKTYLEGNRYSDTDADSGDDATINDAGTGTIYAGQSTGSTSGTDVSNFVFRGANSTTAFAVQNASGSNILNVDTTNSEVEVGSSTTAGRLVISDGSSNTGTILVNATAGDYTFTIPTVTANDTFCLATLGNCANGTLQQAYTNDADGSDAVITLTSTDGAIKVRDAASTIGTLFTVQNNGATLDYLNVASTGTSINVSGGSSVALTVNNGTSTGNILNLQDNGTNVLTVADGGNVGIKTGSNAPSADLTFGDGADRTINVLTRTTNGTGYNLTVIAGSAGTSGAAAVGGNLTLQGGSANGASGSANGGNVSLVGGVGYGSGVKGLVVIDTATYSAAAVQNFTANANITQANIDSYGSILISGNVAGWIATLTDPTVTTAGRVVYVTNSGSVDITLAANTVGVALSITLKPASTATMYWNGTDWTAAGASSSTDLQAAYNNTAASAGNAEIVLSSTGTGGLTIRNDATSAITGGLLEVQTSIGSNLFTVNNNASEFASNGGAESSTFTAWSGAPAGGSVSRYTTVGNNIATGVGSVFVDTTSSANTGAKNTLSSALTANLRYKVSYTARHTSSTGTFNTLETYYSSDGTTASVECGSDATIYYNTWTRVDCTFTPTSTGASNAIIFRHTDGVEHDFYIDNFSVTIDASSNHAVDGAVDSALGTNWQAYDADGGAGTSSVLRDTTNIYDTSGSVAVTTTAGSAEGEGVRNNMTITPSVSTQYLVTFYAKSSNSFSDIKVGFLPAGGSSTPLTAQLCADYNTQTVSTSAWTKITCIFTTPSSGISDPDLVIYQGSAAARTFYVDALSITLNTNNSSNVQVGGGQKGGPTTLFTLDRSYGAPIADNNNAYLGSMYYDTQTGRIQCYEADGWGACGAAPDNIVNLNPEYAGAVLNGTGVGTMTADFCSNDTALSVNSTLCSTGQAKNYYKWTSPQATTQTYSIYVTYQLPATFNGFASDDTVQLVGRVDNTTNASVTYEMYKSTGSAVTQCGSGETNVITGGGGSANTWYSYGISGNEATGCSFNSSSAGNFIIFKINLKANSNANAYVSTLSFTTTGR